MSGVKFPTKFGPIKTRRSTPAGGNKRQLHQQMSSPASVNKGIEAMTAVTSTNGNDRVAVPPPPLTLQGNEFPDYVSGAVCLSVYPL